jgi:site-specific DNA recombinase
MNVVNWARVSSREQREGYSIDAQLRAMREKAERSSWNVVREFVVAESAKRGAERIAFNEMYKWVRANAKRERIEAILSHKLDRVCRNMRDAVRLQELEDACGVKLAFVENQFGGGAAGVLSFNVMAAVAQYYSDNLRSEVIKGMDEKVRQGWPTGAAPFGYINVDDRDEPVRPDQEKSYTVHRIFELYAIGNMTFESLAEKLHAEGHTFRPSQPRFHRTTLSYILNNRFYIGELRRNGQVFEGKYKRFIDRAMFDACQAILKGKNKRISSPQHPWSGGLFRCAICGCSITGERIRRKLKSGGVRYHTYYRCANNYPDEGHAIVRWKADDLEQAIIADLASLRIPCHDAAEWFRRALAAAVSDVKNYWDRQSASLAKRKSELANMQGRLLNAYLAGTIDEATYNAKGAEFKSEAIKIEEGLGKLGETSPVAGELALAVFDFSQNAAETWRGSNIERKREILDLVCLNRALSDVNLVTTKRKPFDVLAERLQCQSSRGDRI